MFFNSNSCLRSNSYLLPEKWSVQINQNSTDNYQHVLLYIWHDKIAKGSVEVHEVPWCCGMLFISNLTTYYRNRGYTEHLFSLVDQFAQMGGYSAVQCIIPGNPTKVQNARLHALFEKHGYKYLKGSRVFNIRSGNYLYTYQKDYK